MIFGETSQWQWLINNGIAVAILVFIAIALVRTFRKISTLIAEWVAPRVDKLITSNLATQEKLQESLDRTDERADLQLVTCKDHVNSVRSTEEKAKANLALWQEACKILRDSAPNVIANEQLVADVQRRVDEMERIIREAG